MPADKYKSTPKDVDVNKVIDTIKGEDEQLLMRVRPQVRQRSD